MKKDGKKNEDRMLIYGNSSGYLVDSNLHTSN